MNESPKPAPVAPTSHAETMEWLLRVAGWVLIAAAAFLGFAASNDYPQERFDNETAAGATANALESLKSTFNAWMFVFLGVAALLYSRLCQIARRHG